MRSRLKVAPASITCNMLRHTVTVSKVSNSGSLSSCMSLLYASGSPFNVTNRPVNAPTTRPALPRRSSAPSGFFLLGIMDEPVVTLSDRRTKLNSCVDHSTNSSPIRLRCTISSDAFARNSTTASRSATPSSELRVIE